MQDKRFTKNDDGFTCAHCGFAVEPLGYTSRNHCPKCLWSIHIDIMPGDRACACLGLLEPVDVETDAKKGYIIVHKCTKCGEIKRNKAAHEAKNQPDDIKKIIRLTVKQ